MPIFHTSILKSLVAGLSVAVCVLSGCGEKKEELSGKFVVTSKEEEKLSLQEEEIPMPSFAPITEERVYYDFETDLSGWEIPLWAKEKGEYTAKTISVSDEAASHGTKSMKITADFPGGIWTAALAEIQQYLYLKPYRVISVDAFLPQDVPIGLKIKLIITINEDWRFVEMSRSVLLIPGEWVTVTASIEPGSYDWKRIVPDKTFAEDVRKVAVRIESNNKPKYSGPIYVDNIRCGK